MNFRHFSHRDLTVCGVSLGDPKAQVLDKLGLPSKSGRDFGAWTNLSENLGLVLEPAATDILGEWLFYTDCTVITLAPDGVAPFLKGVTSVSGPSLEHDGHQILKARYPESNLAKLLGAPDYKSELPGETVNYYWANGLLLAVDLEEGLVDEFYIAVPELVSRAAIPRPDWVRERRSN